MSFTALRFDVPAADAERWSDALLEAGALAVDATDPRQGSPEESPVWGEPADAARAWWPVTRLTVLNRGDADALAVARHAAAAIGGSLPPLETYRVADRDWVRETQAQFGPIRVRDDFWIVPSWRPRMPEARNLVLDPGLAFGTGTHPTTRLCLEWLGEYVSNHSAMLDYGCGSGILAIAAALFGAREVVGTDIDPQAIAASIANAAANGVSARFVHVDALGSETFTHVVANILANPLCLLAPALAARTAPGGRLALSGILASQAGDVIAAYEPWFATSRWRAEDGWVLIAGVRREDRR